MEVEVWLTAQGICPVWGACWASNCIGKGLLGVKCSTRQRKKRRQRGVLVWWSPVCLKASSAPNILTSSLHIQLLWMLICEGLRHIMNLHECFWPVFLFLSLLLPGVTCTPVWSSERSATAATRSRRPTPRRANATWSAKERRATCAEEPTGCPSTGWSWARSQRAAVSPPPRRSSQEAVTYTAAF